MLILNVENINSGEVKTLEHFKTEGAGKAQVEKCIDELASARRDWYQIRKDYATGEFIFTVLDTSQNASQDIVNFKDLYQICVRHFPEVILSPVSKREETSARYLVKYHSLTSDGFFENNESVKIFVQSQFKKSMVLHDMHNEVECGAGNNWEELVIAISPFLAWIGQNFLSDFYWNALKFKISLLFKVRYGTKKKLNIQIVDTFAYKRVLKALAKRFNVDCKDVQYCGESSNRNKIIFEFIIQTEKYKVTCSETYKILKVVEAEN